MTKDYGPGWTREETIIHGASSFMALHLCKLLVEKGLISSSEAAGVMTSTANVVRSGSEDGPGEAYGEKIARSLEQLAGQLLGIPLRGP